MPLVFRLMKNVIKCLPLFLIFTACVASPSLVSLFVEPGVIHHYFIPSTDWKAQGSRASARLDITFRTGVDTPGIVNISFFGEREMPRTISSISLNGRGLSCPLENISVLFPNPGNRELRVTTEADRDALIAVLQAEPITLRAEIDGVMRTFIPDRHFISIKNDFLAATAVTF